MACKSAPLIHRDQNIVRIDTFYCTVALRLHISCNVANDEYKGTVSVNGTNVL